MEPLGLIRGALYSSSEDQVLTWSADGTARIWTLDIDELIERFYTRYADIMCKPPDSALKAQYGLEGLYYEKYCK